MTRQTESLRHILRSRIVITSVTYTAAVLLAVVMCVALGEPILGLLVVGSATLLLTLVVTVVHQRNATAVAASLRRQDVKFRELESLVSQADQRTAQMNHELRAELRNLEYSDRLKGIESSLSTLAHEARPQPSSHSGPEHQTRFSEHDLEMFLVHLLASRNDGIQ